MLPLRDYTDDDMHQLVMDYTSGESVWTDMGAEYTGVKKLTLSFDPCVGKSITGNVFQCFNCYIGIYKTVFSSESYSY